MLNINLNERKQMKFGISVAGIQPRDIKGALRLMIEGIEYGFPVSVIDGTIEVEIPALKNIMLNEANSEKQYDIKLELIANDTYIIPWVDTVKFNTPISIVVHESTIENEKDIKIGVTKIEENSKSKNTKFHNKLIS